MGIEEKVLRFTRENALVGQNDRVLLALSGGADSVCLFHLLRGLRSRLEFNLFVAHLDHGIRPESSADRDFCARLCRKHRVEMLAGRAELGTGASEDQARRARYDFLLQAAGQFACRVVATAHNRDDQAETLLLRLIRGTGLQGLAGIPARREIAGPGRDIRLIRPLLAIPRVEIEAFLAEKKHAFVEDASNREPTYLRNLVRRQLLPLLETYNPAARENLCRLADLLSADYRFIAQEAGRMVEAWCHEGKAGVIAFEAGKFTALPLALQRETLRQAFARLTGNHYRVGFNAVEKARLFCLAGHSGSMVPCADLEIRRRGKMVEIGAEGQGAGANSNSSSTVTGARGTRPYSR